jgi:hypothetical protein
MEAGLLVPVVPGRFVLVIAGFRILVIPECFLLVIPGLDPGIAPTDGVRGDPRIKSGDDGESRADGESRDDGESGADGESGDDEDDEAQVVGPAEGCSGCSPFLMLARHAPTMTSTKESR